MLGYSLELLPYTLLQVSPSDWLKYIGVERYLNPGARAPNSRALALSAGYINIDFIDCLNELRLPTTRHMIF